MHSTIKHARTLPMALAGLAVWSACGNQPAAEAESATAEALLTTSCIAEVPGAFSTWLFDATCTCPKFGDGRDDQCAYEVAVVGCMTAAGAAFSCARPPRIPIVQRFDNGKASATYDELSIANAVGGDCVAAFALQRCLLSLNAKNGPSGTPFAAPPVGAPVLPHCAPALDVCWLKDIANDVWDPCTTKACVQ